MYPISIDILITIESKMHYYPNMIDHFVWYHGILLEAKMFKVKVNENSVDIGLQNYTMMRFS